MTWLAVRAVLGRIPVWVWPLLGLVVWGGVGHSQAHRLRATLDAEHRQRDADAAVALETTRRQAQEAMKAKEVRDAEDKVVRDRLAVALAGLRQRAPQRLPSAAAPACAGAAPAQLSGPDAGVALELAADADRLRAAYGECRAWVETVTRGR